MKRPGTDTYKGYSVSTEYKAGASSRCPHEIFLVKHYKHIADSEYIPGVLYVNLPQTTCFCENKQQMMQLRKSVIKALRENAAMKSSGLSKHISFTLSPLKQPFGISVEMWTQLSFGRRRSILNKLLLAWCFVRYCGKLWQCTHTMVLLWKTCDFAASIRTRFTMIN